MSLSSFYTQVNRAVALITAAAACHVALAQAQAPAPAPAAPAAASPTTPAPALKADAPAAKAAPAPAPTPAPTPAAASSGNGETGLAAVYSDRLNGHKTASGQVYNRDKLTAAHKTLAFGTQVKVTNTKNNKSVTVRINDRGPTQGGRILDMSPAAARAIGIRPTAMADVRLEVVGEAPAKATKPAKK